MIPRQIPAPPWAPVVLYACTPLENSRRLAVDSLRRCALERRWRVAGECTDALPLTAERRPRWEDARRLIDSGAASGLVVPSRLTAAPAPGAWPRVDAWLRERDAFLVVLDPMPPGPAGACVYGDGWAGTSVVVGHNGLWPEHAHPACVQREKPAGALVLPRRIRAPRPTRDDRPATTTWNITDLLKAPAWGPEHIRAAEQRMTDDLTRLLHDTDQTADGTREEEIGDGDSEDKHLCDYNCDCPDDAPEGWCVYGDGWACPALILPYHPVLDTPGWPRHAHPECHARALAEAGDVPAEEAPGELAGQAGWVAGCLEGGSGRRVRGPEAGDSGPSCGLESPPACRGGPCAQAEPDEGSGAAEEGGGR